MQVAPGTVEKGCTPAVSSSSYTLTFQIPGGDAGGQGRLCITSPVPIVAID